MTIVLVSLAVLLGAVSLALLVPVRFAARGALDGTCLSASAEASWGGGIAEVRVLSEGGVVVRLLRLPVYRGALGGLSSASPPKVGRTGRSPGLRFLWHVIRRVVPSLRLRARVTGRVGIGDPADTGGLFAALSVARRVLPSLDLEALKVDWVAPALDLRGQVEGRVWPVAIAWIVASEYARARRSNAA